MLRPGLAAWQNGFVRFRAKRAMARIRIMFPGHRIVRSRPPATNMAAWSSAKRQGIAVSTHESERRRSRV
jgi:hypothetical protein